MSSAPKTCTQLLQHMVTAFAARCLLQLVSRVLSVVFWLSYKTNQSDLKGRTSAFILTGILLNCKEKRRLLLKVAIFSYMHKTFHYLKKTRNCFVFMFPVRTLVENRSCQNHSNQRNTKHHQRLDCFAIVKLERFVCTKLDKL